MKYSRLSVALFVLSAVAVGTWIGCKSESNSTNSSGGGAAKPAVTLLNVSYDPTRELYNEFNKSFAEYWKEKNSQDVKIETTHAGSGKQARAVIDGLEADVVTLALAYDIDVIAEKGKLLPDDWQAKLPNNSSPYTSTIVFLVRKGNPKKIKDWSDLVKGDVQVITPSPKTSGGARWNYLAAWGFALQKELGDLSKLADVDAKAREAADVKAKEFVAEIFRRVPVLDTGARGATQSFIKNGQGDVLLTWENEAYLAVKNEPAGEYEIVTPSLSILAEPPVAVVENFAAKHKTTEVAEAYLQHLYSPQGQQLAAKHFYRPAKPETLSAEQRAQFADVKLFKINEAFGSWKEAQAKHFNDGGVFDQIYQPGSK
ncbi:sulfate ABC transporter substrate-binding protein [Anatilimnocola floriformis]|uniref:sulfate ABC transporter substrate-binding protein n=1 Tax=Anatilimnocola floriformis TaxID=2948575 RepID=UPI0020C3663D|nr:sulfate ABC transporter substrate-binding protein [Anatilimnocola floriformis]